LSELERPGPLAPSDAEGACSGGWARRRALHRIEGGGRAIPGPVPRRRGRRGGPKPVAQTRNERWRWRSSPLSRCGVGGRPARCFYPVHLAGRPLRLTAEL